MSKYWFKKYGKYGNIPATWQGWAVFVFVVALLIQASNFFRNTPDIFIATGVVATLGYLIIRWKTNPVEVFSKDDSVWKTQVWGGIIGLIGSILVMVIIFPLQAKFIDSPVKSESTKTSVTDSNIAAKSENVQSTGSDNVSKNAYINRKFGFQITSPENWIVDEGGENDTVVFFLNKEIDDESGYKWQGGINVGVFSGNSGFKLFQIVDSYKQQAQQWSSDLYVIEGMKRSIGGYDAVIVSSTFVREGHKFRDYRLFVLKGDNVFNISAVVLSSTWDQYREIITESVLSFDFI